MAADGEQGRGECCGTGGERDGTEQCRPVHEGDRAGRGAGRGRDRGGEGDTRAERAGRERTHQAGRRRGDEFVDDAGAVIRVGHEDIAAAVDRDAWPIETAADRHLALGRGRVRREQDQRRQQRAGARLRSRS